MADLVDSHIGRLDIDKLETTSVNVGKLSNVVIKNVVKKNCIWWISSKCQCKSDYW